MIIHNFQINPQIQSVFFGVCHEVQYCQNPRNLLSESVMVAESSLPVPRFMHSTFGKDRQEFISISPFRLQSSVIPVSDSKHSKKKVDMHTSRPAPWLSLSKNACPPVASSGWMEVSRPMSFGAPWNEFWIVPGIMLGRRMLYSIFRLCFCCCKNTYDGPSVLLYFSSEFFHIAPLLSLSANCFLFFETNQFRTGE